MVGLANDLRYALRILARNPGFAFTAGLVLALGIGSNVVAFALVNTLLLRPLRVPHPEQLARMYATYAGGPQYFTVSYPDYLDANNLGAVFSGVIADRPAAVNLSAAGTNERVWAYITSPNYFSVLGLQPAAGRFFAAGDDDERGGRAVAVLEHGFWLRRFGGDPRIVGRALAINGQPATIVGVAPDGFHGVNLGLTVDLWLPVSTRQALVPDGDTIHRRGGGGYFVLARRQPGVTLEQARAPLDVLGRQLQREYPNSNKDITFTLLPEVEGGVHPMVRGSFVSGSTALVMVMGVVLLLASTNIAGLLLARGAARRREIGIRLALGAARGRLVGQLLTESLVLWIIAGAAGTCVAAAVVKALSSITLPTDRPVFVDVGMDLRVIAFSFSATIATGILFGLVPALAASKRDTIARLRESGTAIGFRSPLRSVLVGAQVAMCVVLLLGATLCLRSLDQARHVNLGFDPNGIVMASVNLRLQGYDENRAHHFLQELTRRLSSIPGVASVGLTNRVPFELQILRTPAAPVGREDLRSPSIDWATVDRGYFRTMRVPLRDGRVFDGHDTHATDLVAVINETLARRFWPGERAVGKRIRIGGMTRSVIGVVGDGKYLTLGEAPTPFIFFPLEQTVGFSETVLVRAAGSPSAVLGRVRNEIAGLDAALPAYNVQTMEQHLGLALAPAGGSASVLGGFGALALLLVAVGLYGMLAFAVTRRTHEIGIRRALGARDVDVIVLVVRQAIGPVLLGLAAGGALGWMTVPVLRSVLYGVSPADPLAYAGAAITLFLTAVLACGLPTARAAKIVPMDALRED